MTDLAKIVATGRRDDKAQKQLVRYTHKHGNTVLLIVYLRRIARQGIDNAPALIPELAAVIADVLDGTLKAKPKRFTAYDRVYLRRLVTATKELLAARDPDAVAVARKVLRYVPQTKREISEAALAIVAEQLRLSSPRVLEGLLYPRAGRGRRG